MVSLPPDPLLNDNYLNPIRAGICKRPEEYRWCSLGYHIQTHNKDHFLSLDFGFLASRSKKKYLSICRELFGLSPELPKQEDKTTQELMLELTGIDINICPVCKKGRMKIIAEIPVISKACNYLRSCTYFNYKGKFPAKKFAQTQKKITLKTVILFI